MIVYRSARVPCRKLTPLHGHELEQGGGEKHECVPEVLRFLHLPHCMWRNLNQKKSPSGWNHCCPSWNVFSFKGDIVVIFSQNQHKVQKHPANKNDSIFHTFSMLFAKSGQIGTLNKITFARNLFCKWLCNKNLSNTHTFIGPLLSLWEEYISLFRKAPKLAQKMLISLWIKLVKYRWWCWQKHMKKFKTQ